MHKHAADALAVKVRAQLTGTPGIAGVDAVHLNPLADTAGEQGWAVTVARSPGTGGPITIIGNDRIGYRTTEQGAAQPRTLPVLVREVFLAAQPEDTYVWPDDTALGGGIRAACASLSSTREALGRLAQDVETRRQHGPWLVIVTRTSTGRPRAYGPYLNPEEAATAAERLGGVATQAQPEPKEADHG